MADISRAAAAVWERSVCAAVMCAALHGAVFAQSAALPPAAAPPQGPPALGSSNTATADPPLPRPTTRPFQVTLFHHLRFADYVPKTFTYHPPPGGTGRRRWAKIVLTADFSVTTGRQFDRTAQIAIGRTNVYFGTTAEPSVKGGQSWHVERDVTDDSALLQAAQPGEADLGTVVDDKYTGVFEGSAALLFYPADAQNPPADPPDMVLPLADTASGTAGLSTDIQTLTRTFTLPTNVVRAYLDLITQSQGKDEFWYLSVPDKQASRLQSGGGTAFREAEVSVDGTLAGIAPVFPWIYTGGIDPALWRPLPGVQTLSFVPYRVDLTPFAGVLSDGKPHTVGVRVVNDRDSFQVAGTLLLYRDPVLRVVRGALSANTLRAGPAPVVKQSLVQADGGIAGPLSVTSARRFVTEGYVLSSGGKVSTRVAQSVEFSNTQRFDKSATSDDQTVAQTTRVVSATTTRSPALVVEQQQNFAYPLTITFLHHAERDGTATQMVAIRQGLQVSERCWVNGMPLFARTLSNTVSPTDTLLFSAKGAVVGSRRRTSVQTFHFADTLGNRYFRTLAAANGVLTQITEEPKRLGAVHL